MTIPDDFCRSVHRPVSRVHSALSTLYSVLSTQYSVLRPTSRLAAIAALSFLLNCSAFCADQSNEDPAIKAGQDALASGGKFPWYDSREDDVRRLNIVPRQSDDTRGDKWAEDSATMPKATRTTRSGSLLGGILQWVGLTALVLLLGMIAYLIATAFLKEEVSDDVAVRKVVESRRDADRIEALPFQVRAAGGDFLAEARRLSESGRFSEAIIYLFSHELMQLDKHHVIRLAKGKTNRQYVRETRHRPLLASILQITMIAFEDAFFGNKTLTREAFEQCWRRLDEFDGELSREERAAA